MTIQSKIPTPEYKDGWDRIFGKKRDENRNKLFHDFAAFMQSGAEICPVESENASGTTDSKTTPSSQNVR